MTTAEQLETKFQSATIKLKWGTGGGQSAKIRYSGKDSESDNVQRPQAYCKDDFNDSINTKLKEVFKELEANRIAREAKAKADQEAREAELLAGKAESVVEVELSE